MDTVKPVTPIHDSSSTTTEKNAEDILIKRYKKLKSVTDELNGIALPLWQLPTLQKLMAFQQGKILKADDRGKQPDFIPQVSNTLSDSTLNSTLAVRPGKQPFSLAQSTAAHSLTDTTPLTTVSGERSRVAGSVPQQHSQATDTIASLQAEAQLATQASELQSHLQAGTQAVTTRMKVADDRNQQPDFIPQVSHTLSDTTLNSAPARQPEKQPPSSAQTTQAAVQQQLAMQAQPASATVMTYHFHQWGADRSVTIQEQHNGTLLLRPSDIVVEQRLKDAWHTGDTQNWQLMREQGNHDQQKQQQQQQRQQEDDA